MKHLRWQNRSSIAVQAPTIRRFEMAFRSLTAAILAAVIPFVVVTAVTLSFCPSATAADQTDTRTQQARFENFSKSLSGATLVGQFSIEGRERPPATERYELESVTKLDPEDPDNPFWVFLARIKYGDNDTKIPMTLPVLWAGDTPVISLTNLTIPGMGTFSARVLFDGNRYVGTWQHGEVGGHMWGMIERPADTSKNNESK